ncbi:DNA repair protein RecO [Lysinibacter cavernae]|uniref:DNA repair protein RecO n=1 Tax=Lysinibacter cavernae TaxID=1640652 RepID=A0A7X5QZZ3_9MICO|nr:DNA repair protein RecO [Lysinibacter cavernae]NIH52992.1 DNA repair protein RecO (recombination protein O) [Lysinibacter cavernae]
MPLYRDEAVILRTHKLGESDRIVTMLSRDHGQIRAVAKGVRRTASKFGSRLEPFMVADVQLYEGRTLDTITQAETLGAYGAAIASDYDTYQVANVMVETAERLTDAEPARQQYMLLVGALRSLSQAEHPPGLTRDSYLLRALALAGWAPNFSECVRCGQTIPAAAGDSTAMVVQLGGTVCDDDAPPGSPRLSAASVDLLAMLLMGEWERAIAHPEAVRGPSHGFVSAYTQFHIEKDLRSLHFGA